MVQLDSTRLLSFESEKMTFADQRWMILFTYGPQSKGDFDVDSEIMGFEFFGCFETREGFYI
jgi:hypothetical protein